MEGSSFSSLTNYLNVAAGEDAFVEMREELEAEVRRRRILKIHGAIEEAALVKSWMVEPDYVVPGTDLDLATLAVKFLEDTAAAVVDDDDADAATREARELDKLLVKLVRKLLPLGVLKASSSQIWSSQYLGPGTHRLDKPASRIVPFLPWLGGFAAGVVLPVLAVPSLRRMIAQAGGKACVPLLLGESVGMVIGAMKASEQARQKLRSE
ncbi:hypothetical protein JCM10213v2_002740 [Rhodosporidiobolus nylandii]